MVWSGIYCSYAGMLLIHAFHFIHHLHHSVAGWLKHPITCKQVYSTDSTSADNLTPTPSFSLMCRSSSCVVKTCNICLLSGISRILIDTGCLKAPSRSQTLACQIQLCNLLLWKAVCIATMQLNHWATSLETVYQITCTFPWCHKKIYTTFFI